VSRPTVSCVLAVLDASRFVAEALASIRRQTCGPIEVIVVDGGSQDDTVEVVRRADPAAQVIAAPGTGPAAARNWGVEAARGEFIGFLDADDLWHPEKVSRQLARFETRPDLAACVTHVQVFWAPERAAEREALAAHWRAGPVPGFTTPALLARRTLFAQVGGFRTDLSFGDATEWFLRVARAGAPLDVLPDVLVYHRLHARNLTRRRAGASRAEFVELVKAALDERRAGALAMPFGRA
jgi:glycosyltransferase involved in cell wall biosynthesis